MRIFYWCAFYGSSFAHFLRLMVRVRRWSPFIKSFKGRSIISGSIWGNQDTIVRYLLEDYKYSVIHADQAEDFAKTVFNKDSSDNNCLHYSYMVDMPEVRQILRDTGFYSMRSNRLNRRGQLPTQLRHAMKAEDSNQDTEDEDLYEQQEQLLIEGEGIDTAGAFGDGDGAPAVEELLAGKLDYDINNPADRYRLKFNKDLTRKQKLAYYKAPDYCLVTRADTLHVLRVELDSLVSRGGVYYSIFDKIEAPEDFEKTERAADVMMVVLYFDDSVIDLMAEILGVECRLSSMDCQMQFSCYASDMFDQFNSRQHQSIITQTLENELDIAYLKKSGVIIDNFFVHLPERELIYKSWMEYRWRLSAGMVLNGFLNNMQPLNFIKDYYGEKFGFYFAWLIHYTGQLIPMALLGTLMGIAILIDGIAEGRAGDHLMASPWIIVYGVVLTIWVTLFHESWKRKQNYIANEWLVRNFQDVTTERPEF